MGPAFPLADPSTPADERITRVRLGEDTVRKMALTSTVIDWPEVETEWLREGALSTSRWTELGTMRSVAWRM
jgi:tRNA A37 threonylcarbamoyladenosine synthetase subunit TsaC/SUA5/YrdC